MNNPEYQTQLRDLVEQMRIAAPNGTIYLGIYKAAARFAVPENAAFIYGFLNDFGRMFVIAETHFEERGVNLRVPRELRYFALTLCPPGIELASQVLYQGVDNVHTACMLSANAGADTVHETLITEFPYGEFKRFYRQMPFDVLPGLPRNGRFLDKVSTIKLASAIWGHPDRERLMVTAAHYREALRLWREGAKPLVLMHLYIAVEALTKVIIRHEMATRPCNEAELMVAFGVDPAEKSPMYRLQNRVSEDIIFKKDAATFKAARKASNGIEHGYAGFQDIWNMPFDVNRRTAQYVRSAMFSTLALDEESKDLLLGPNYAAVSEPQDPPSIQGCFGLKPLKRLGIKPVAEPGDWRALEYKPVLDQVIVYPDEVSYSFKYRDTVM